MRWVNVLLAIAALAVMYALGYVSGSRSTDASQSLTSESADLPSATTVVASADMMEPMPPGFAAALAARDWDALVELLEQSHVNGDSENHALMHNRMLEVAADFGEQDAPLQGIALLQTFIELNPHDEPALFALADLYAQQEEYGLALEPVLQILDYPRTVELANQAAGLRDQYIAARSEQLVQASLDERIAFFRHLSEREPNNDQHRLALAAVLGEAGQLDDAAEVLSAIGGYGVAPEAVSSLERELQMAAAGVPIERVQDALYANIVVNGENLRLLVDTGASTTVIDSASLDAISARRANRVARLLTAGGPIRADVYEVNDLHFGGLRLESFEVVALDSVPQQTQGLLGMDLLNQVSDLGFQ